MGELVTYEKIGAVARIGIDDGKVNVMSAAMLRALHDAFARAEAERAVVLLSGRPGIFSAGFDLKVFQTADPDAVYDMLRQGAELALRLLSFPLPIVAACTGHAYPMGAFLLLGSDIRLGADGPYRLGLNEVAIGLTLPGFAVEMARQRLAPAWFQRTALTGEMFTPKDAALAGILDHLVAPKALETAAHAAAEALTKIDLAAHAATKRKVRGPAIAAVRAAIDAEITPAAYRARAA